MDAPTGTTARTSPHSIHSSPGLCALTTALAAHTPLHRPARSSEGSPTYESYVGHHKAGGIGEGSHIKRADNSKPVWVFLGKWFQPMKKSVCSKMVRDDLYGSKLGPTQSMAAVRHAATATAAATNVAAAAAAAAAATTATARLITPLPSRAGDPRAELTALEVLRRCSDWASRGAVRQGRADHTRHGERDNHERPVVPHGNRASEPMDEVPAWFRRDRRAHLPRASDGTLHAAPLARDLERARQRSPPSFPVRIPRRSSDSAKFVSTK